MAKLSAHGTELARFRKTLPGDEDIEWRRAETVFMSDGWQLSKLTIRFRDAYIFIAMDGNLIDIMSLFRNRLMDGSGSNDD